MEVANNAKVDEGIYPRQAGDEIRHFDGVESLITPDHHERMNRNCLIQSTNERTALKTRIEIHTSIVKAVVIEPIDKLTPGQDMLRAI
jgi:hypothetical protein